MFVKVFLNNTVFIDEVFSNAMEEDCLVCSAMCWCKCVRVQPT